MQHEEQADTDGGVPATTEDVEAAAVGDAFDEDNIWQRTSTRTCRCRRPGSFCESCLEALLDEQRGYK